MLALSWNQVNNWRLTQHDLLERAAGQDFLNVVSHIGGVHAQLMSAAELILWARVEDLSPAAVQEALWRDRTLVKTWAMRGTLHLLKTSEFPLYIAARRAQTIRRPPSWFQYHGVTPDELAAIIENVPAALGGSGITREQLAEAIANRTGNPKLRDLLLSGWGALLKPSAFQGDLCFGPNQGQNVTFVRPDQWLAEEQPVEPAQAWPEVAHRFLTTYGPATVDEFARWWGIPPSQAKPLFRSLKAELVEVDVEGWQAWALLSTIEQLQALDVPRPVVRLLPNFDPYTLAVARHYQYLLPEASKERVYRPQGWISPVVLVDGRIEGVWAYDKQRAQVVVTIELFGPPSTQVKHHIEVEAMRLGQFVDSPVEIIYAP